MSAVSRETAALALDALAILLERAKPQRNGQPLPTRWVTAFRELASIAHAADGTKGDGPQSAVTPFELVDSAEAARRLGVAQRTVRARLAKGRLVGQKVGRTWVVEWRSAA